jgi:hypothetical protein
MLPLLLVVAAVAQAAGQPTHDKAYWRAIAAARFEVPAGETPQRLAAELMAGLGSSDPEWRDDLAFSTLSAWIYRKRLLGPGDLRPMIQTLTDNLRKGVGETDGDGVVLRSFSALTLSVIAALDNEAPFLTSEEYARLLDAALAYLQDERDLRGFDPRRGWMHSAAHTADLLKFLARNPHLSPRGQARILAALTAKNREATAPFNQGEDERMARVAISIARRADFDREGFRSWLVAAKAAAAFPNPATVEALRAHQNVRHLLAALWTELSVDERPSEGAEFAKSTLRDALKGLF